ncbi:MAG: transcription termination/antitermination protein NusA [Candidatus Latescibacterota bacterium]|nr:MAG: transcription termination/antitermination protein NusA [Candidatus Latescibacterota bacterium]
MNGGFVEAFAQIIREKKVDKSTLVEMIKSSLVSAGKRKYGQNAEFRVVLDESKGMLEIYRVFKIVDEVAEPAAELTLPDAKAIDKGAKADGEIEVYISLDEFGRNAVQTAKQVLMQKVREAERDRIYDEYKDKVGVIVSGTVRQVDRGNILVNLGRAEAYLPLREQIRKERYNQGDTIRAIIIEVDKNAKGPQVTLSRTSEQFLRKLFEQEVPEIFDGDVEIKSIAREPGGRSKIAVHSRNDKVDAVGSCVGMKGSRVQAVVNELHGEKIDIVSWNEGQNEFVAKALAPARVSSLRFNESEHSVLAIVEDDQLSLAIGKEGQNVRLAAKLTGWKIDLITMKEIERRDKLDQKLQMDISEMYGVTPKMSQKLKSIGILTVQKLHKTPLDDLLEIEGIGEKTAQKLKNTAAETMEELNKALQELLEKEQQETEEEKPLFDESIFGPDEKEEKPEAPLTEADLFKDLGDESSGETEEDGDAAEEETAGEETSEEGPGGEEIEDEEAGEEEAAEEETGDDEAGAGGVLDEEAGGDDAGGSGAEDSGDEPENAPDDESAR